MGSRSDAVQYKYREISIDPVLVNNFSVEDGLFHADYKKTDELIDLVEELNNKIKEIIDNRLTARQKEVMILMYYDGLTQTEIAIQLGLCQPTIHKPSLEIQITKMVERDMVGQ